MNNFAVLTIAYSHTATSIIITITTNTPCHLTCYYTDKEPGSHRTSRNQRGLTLPWGVYYCFVAWLSVEQTEPGDTLTHTFEIPAWSYCQIKWLAFRGTVAGELSPSVSPIFQHHHPGIPVITQLLAGYVYVAGTTGSVMGVAQTPDQRGGMGFSLVKDSVVESITLYDYYYYVQTPPPDDPGEGNVSIRAVGDDYLPIGGDLVIKSFAVTDRILIAGYPPYETVIYNAYKLEIPLAPPIALPTGNYALLIDTTVGGSWTGNHTYWHCRIRDKLTWLEPTPNLSLNRRYRLYSGDGGFTWSEHFTPLFMFKVFGTS